MWSVSWSQTNDKCETKMKKKIVTNISFNFGRV